MKGPCATCDGFHELLFGGPALQALESLLGTIESTGRVDFEAEKGASELRLSSLQMPGEGKMIGVLIGVDAEGNSVQLRAFSGRLGGSLEIPGWVEPVVDVASYAAEERTTLALLNELKETLGCGIFAGVNLVEAHAELSVKREELASSRTRLAVEEDAARESRGNRRVEMGSTDQSFALLDQESRETSARYRRERARLRKPVEALEREIQQAEEERVSLRRKQNAHSRTLTARIQAAYRLQGVSGSVRSVPEVFHDGGRKPPTGTGDCCAPKLLTAAARRGIQPIALAECWLGATASGGSRTHGQLHLPCTEKCVPILGFLLCPVGGEGT